MSTYSTVTLGGFITHEEVVELAALLAQSDCYPAIMLNDEGGDIADEPDADADDHMVIEFYRDHITRCINNAGSLKFSFDPEADYKDAEWKFIHDTFLPWVDKRAARMLVRIDQPNQTSLHGSGWRGESVSTDSCCNPLLDFPWTLIDDNAGPNTRIVKMSSLTKFLCRVHEAELIHRLWPPGLALIRSGPSDRIIKQRKPAPRFTLLLPE